jgi:glyoxylase-like metal-dependent hydrolase (beta-lactamase superfamily II)
MAIYPVIAEHWKMDGGVAFGVVPQSIWKRIAAPDGNNMIRITSRCLLVVDGKRRILFDTGMGNKQSAKYYGFRYLFGEESLEKSLNKTGFVTDDITDVVFTHLHDDHCGGAVKLNKNGEPELVFKNAMHYCSYGQWEWANHPNSREAGSYFKINFLPLKQAGKLTLIEKPGQFSEKVRLVQMNGHTHGQLIPIISENGKTFVFAADFIPTAAHIPVPFVASVDIRPLEALREKEEFLEEAAEKNYLLVFEHDYDVECCSLMRTEKGIRMEKQFLLNEFLN